MKGPEYANYNNVAYFYDGTPVPELLTEQEAIKFLRLDDGNTQKPSLTLQYYRSEGFLRATKVGKRLRYLKSELMNFLNILTERTNNDIS